MKKWMTLLIAVCVLGGAGFAVRKFAFGAKTEKTVFVTSEIAVKDIRSTIAASGTIEPEELIDVGSQVSGQILEFGKDEHGKAIDYRANVKEGMLLAKIDDVTYLADLDVARAQLNNANAAVAVSEANLEQAEAKLRQATKNWERAQKIGVGNAMSQASFDAYEAEFDSAKAGVSVAKASILQSKASVIQAQASLEKAERNLSYCTISSPVDGVVIDRRVNVGQTVVSSMSASSLFLIAKDLKRVQIWVAVNEADIGEIKVGTPVSFTVSAFPDMTFTGTVSRIRLNATITSNVVTYTVEVDTDNSDEVLLPYLTANVNFETAVAKEKMTVPARALRWRPADLPRAPLEENQGVVFTVDAQGQPVPHIVNVVLTDGTETAVESDTLRPGMRVITGTQVLAEGKNGNGAGESAGGNPFMPKMPGRPRGGAGGPPR